MTPEQRAASPVHPPARASQDAENLAAIERLIREVREIRRERWSKQYPVGHIERETRLPPWVLDGYE